MTNTKPNNTDTLTAAAQALLQDLAATIRKDHALVRWEERAIKRAVEAKFRIGHALVAARALFPGDREYGRWLAAQGFEFGTRQAGNYKFAAEHEQLVRAVMCTETDSGRAVSFTDAVRLVRNPPKKADKWAAPSRRPQRSVPGRYLPLLVARADVALRDLDSEDPATGLPAKRKLRDALDADIKREQALLASREADVAA